MRTSRPLGSVCFVNDIFMSDEPCAVSLGWSSPRDNGALAPKIGAAAQPAGGRVDACRDDTGGDAERGSDQQDMSARLQLLEHRRRERRFHFEHAGLGTVIVERA